jgi:hypothetical protein
VVFLPDDAVNYLALLAGLLSLDPEPPGVRTSESELVDRQTEKEERPVHLTNTKVVPARR